MGLKKRMKYLKLLLILVIFLALFFVKNDSLIIKAFYEYRSEDQTVVEPMRDVHLDIISSSKEEIRVAIIFCGNKGYNPEGELDDDRTYLEVSNSFNFESLDINCSRVFISKYTPFVFCVFNNPTMFDMNSIIYRLSESDRVENIYISKNFKRGIEPISIDELDLQESVYQPQGVDLRDIPYDYFPNGTSLTGEGVNIGVLDIGIFDSEHPNFSEINAYNLTSDYDGNYTSDEIHPIMVASILGGKYGIANKASIYFADANSDDGFYAIEKLIFAGVDIVNMSVSLEELSLLGHFSYHDFLYMECISYATNVILVGVTGNDLSINGAPGNVGQPGNTTTVISVGSIDLNGMPSNFSNYRRYNYYQISKSKPEIVAVGENRVVPGVGTDSGTSYSAPAITGTIALLIEKHGELINPQSALALLLASSSDDVNTGQTIINGTVITNNKKAGGDLRERTGAGRLDIEAVLEIPSSNIRTNIDVNSDGLYEDINLNLGDTVIISMVYNRTFAPYDWHINHVWGEDDITNISLNPFTNVDLYLKKGVEVLDVSSYSYSNIQFIRTTVSQTTNYNISSSGWENVLAGSVLNYAIYIEHNCQNPVQYNAIYHLYTCCDILERHSFYYAYGQFICDKCGYVQKTPPVDPESQNN